MSVFVQSGSNSAAGPTTTLAVTLAAATAGNLIVVWSKYEGTATTTSLSDGTATLTNGTEIGAGTRQGRMSYLLSATGGATTYTLTLGANKTTLRLIVMEFSPTAGKTWSFDIEGTGTGNGTAIATNSITTTGTDEIVVGAVGERSSAGAKSSPQIAGIAAAGSKFEPASWGSWQWYRILTATMNGTASITNSVSEQWYASVMGFTAAAAGGEPGPLTGFQTHRTILTGVCDDILAGIDG